MEGRIHWWKFAPRVWNTASTFWSHEFLLCLLRWPFSLFVYKVLTKEYYTLQTSLEKRNVELEASVSEKKAKLEAYEKLEQDLDAVVMQAAEGVYYMFFCFFYVKIWILINLCFHIILQTTSLWILRLHFYAIWSVYMITVIWIKLFFAGISFMKKYHRV